MLGAAHAVKEFDAKYEVGDHFAYVAQFLGATYIVYGTEEHHERIWVYDNHIIAMNALIEWEHPLGEPEGYSYPLEIWNEEQEALYAQLEEELSPIVMPDPFEMEFGELSDWSEAA